MDHDEGMSQRVDTIVEDDVRRGYRVKELPENLLRSLREALDGEPTMPQFTHVRFNKITPKKKRLINEEVIRRYHADIQNKALLSSARLRELNIERGEWSLAQEERMKWLETETNRMMRSLYSDGFNARDEWATSLITITTRIRDIFEAGLDEDGREVSPAADREQLLRTFDRWLEYTPSTQGFMDAKYGEQFPGGKYDVDSDYRMMLTLTPQSTASDLLNEADDLREKLGRYIECLDYREELLKLQVRQAKMLAESVEQRRDMTEEMARLYICSEICTPTGVATGHLAKTFDALWELPEDVINWLLVEIFFFFEGTPDVEGARDFLSQWGFIAAPELTSANGAKVSSGALQEVPSSSIDSPPVAAMPVDSSPSMIPTN